MTAPRLLVSAETAAEDIRNALAILGTAQRAFDEGEWPTDPQRILFTADDISAISARLWKAIRKLEEQP